MSDKPAINESLIRQYANRYRDGDETAFRDLITVFDFQRRQMQRAEELSRIAWQEVERKAKLAPSLYPESNTQPTTRAAPTAPKAAGASRKPTAPALAEDLNMDDL